MKLWFQILISYCVRTPNRSQVRGDVKEPPSTKDVTINISRVRDQAANFHVKP